LPIQSFLFLLFISAAALIVVCFFAFRIRNRANLIFEKETRYHHIMVYEDGYIRTLRLGKGYEAGKQSRVDIRSPHDLILEYTRLVFSGLLINDRPDSILIIGLGGGVIPRAFNRYFPEAKIDVVDIDPDVLDVAEKYFLFKHGKNINAHISDGRVFVEDKIRRNHSVKYDIIILDAYDSSSIPGHLLTKEFLELIARVMNPKGVIVANVLSDNNLFHSIIKTYREVFGRCYVFMGEQAKNAVLVTPGKDVPDLVQVEIMEKAYYLNKNYDFNFSMAPIVRKLKWGYMPKKLSRVLKDPDKI
jgi:spermidine synthase